MVCIIGGGISGLCMAYKLKQAGVEVTLFEKGDRVGGNIRSEKIDGFLIEHGPNSLLVGPDLVELIEDLGLLDQVALAQPAAKKRFILKDRKLLALPSKPADIFRLPLSLSGTVRAICEPLIRTRSNPQESVADFFARRFGEEVADFLVDPFISGIYAGDPKKLGIKNAFGKLYDLESEYGSVIKGFIRKPKDRSAKRPESLTRTISFKNGLQTLTDKLAEELGESLLLCHETNSVRTTNDGRFEVRVGEETRVFDAVVISSPAYIASGLIELPDAQFAAQLSKIEYPPIAVVYTAFKNEDVGFDLNGFGFLVPGLEKRKILGSLWTSSVFEGRAPAGLSLMTTFIGGSRSGALARRPEDELVETALGELHDILKISGRPIFTKVKKWEHAIPQYNIGYENFLAVMESFRRDTPGIFFCSNFYGGISVGDCVKNSAKNAKEVLDLIGNE